MANLSSHCLVLGILVGFGLLQFQAPLGHAEPDQNLSKEILGKWRYKGTQMGAAIESVAHFQPEGEYHCRMIVRILGTNSRITFKGKWKLTEQSKVVIEVTETDSPLLLPKGKVMKKEGVKISGDIMTYKYDGKSEREERVVEDEKQAKQGATSSDSGEK